MNFLPLGLGSRRTRFPVQDHQRAAQRHARRQQAGEQPGKVFEGARRDFFRFFAERQREGQGA
jgi:hypothetical protein